MIVECKNLTSILQHQKTKSRFNSQLNRLKINRKLTLISITLPGVLLQWLTLSYYRLYLQRLWKLLPLPYRFQLLI